jgi:D-alanyl-D-alanine carboxypeptidase
VRSTLFPLLLSSTLLAAALLAPSAVAHEETPESVAFKVSELLQDPSLGTSVGLAIQDVGSGEILFDTGGSFIPASTMKLVTALVALRTLGADQLVTVSTKPGVRNVPVAVLLRRMLLKSDNRAARILGEAARRQLIPVRDSMGAAYLALLESEQISTVGVNVVDAAGLSRENRLTPTLLVTLLQILEEDPRLKVAGSSLPVAGVSGTMRSRPLVDSQGNLLNVRAKTGTLTGVTALAGVIRLADGHQLSFAVIADRVRVSKERARLSVDALPRALADD